MKKLFLQKRLFGFLFWIWGVVIVVLSSLPNIPTQKLNVWDEPFRLDYLEHFGVFAILVAFFVVWKSDALCSFDKKKYLGVLALLVIFAIVDETHQLWIEGRTFNPLDMMYNVLGILTAYFVGPAILKWLCIK